jgi:hypothetical protein
MPTRSTRFAHTASSPGRCRFAARTLDDILTEAGAGRRFEFLSVDVEGHELEVLQGLDLSKWRPRVVIAEDNSLFRDGAVRGLLRAHGYVPFRRTGVNDWYAESGDLELASAASRWAILAQVDGHQGRAFPRPAAAAPGVSADPAATPMSAPRLFGLHSRLQRRRLPGGGAGLHSSAGGRRHRGARVRRRLYDGTAALVASYQARFPRLRYELAAARGGIDADMAKTVALAQGEYCWLFSGDDVMFPEAIPRLLGELQAQPDVCVLEHRLCNLHMQVLSGYPVIGAEHGLLRRTV